MTRFHITLATGAVLAATLFAPVITDAHAQGGQGDQGGSQRGGRMGGMGRMGHGPLFKDITLTDAQKAQLDSINKRFVPSRDSMRAQMEAIRKLRESNDTAGMRAAREKMTARNKERNDAIIAILTPEQRTQFEKNRAEREKQMKEARERGGRGGFRGGRRGGSDRPAN